MPYYTRSNLEEMLEKPNVTKYAKRIFREALKTDADEFPELGERSGNYLSPTLPGASPD